MNLYYMSYEYSKSNIKVYYLTLNGKQFGPPFFYLTEILQKIESIKKGETFY